MKKEVRAQVTIFIIIAIILVVSIALYFILRGNTWGSGIPKELAPVYSYFEDCMEGNLLGAVNLMETQGGWIYLPEFERGNGNFPSSSQMDFFGFGVPYWSYVSISGTIKEQVPLKGEMEEQISRYLESNFGNCDFSKFFQQGYQINFGEMEVETSIESVNTDALVNMPLSVSFGEVVADKSDFKISLNSKFGQLYDEAYSLYQKQKTEKFVEGYGVDILRLYAPVDGVELSCAPMTWNPSEVVSELLNATEANIAAIKFSSNDDYKLVEKENKYFVVNFDGKDNARIIYSKNFPTKVEIWPVENDIMIAKPVGQESGMGIIGFCYVPYHFVYDFTFPVMMQVYDNTEIFQFPFVANIEKNQVNPNSISEAIPTPDNSLCQYKTSPLNVYTYNNKLEPVAANISFKCFTTECDIGETEIRNGDAFTSENFPACVNGFVIAKAEGYADGKVMVSTNEESEVNILLDREYELDVNLSGIGNSMALVSFISERESTSIVYPEQRKVKLSEGDYNISVYVYRNTSITFPASSSKKCVDIPKSGIAGFFGGTEEQCYDLDVPSQTITFALAGGGNQNSYFIESALEEASTLVISPTMLASPSSLESLQKNYVIVDSARVGVSLV